MSDNEIALRTVDELIAGHRLLIRFIRGGAEVGLTLKEATAVKAKLCAERREIVRKIKGAVQHVG